MKTLLDLANATRPRRLTGDATSQIHDIHYDSRAVQPGDLFVALRGGYFDGHDFRDQAVERGATAIMAEHDKPGFPCLVFDDTREALPRVAAAFFGYPAKSMKVIGITGTDGKTTTSYLVNAILEHAGRRTGMIGTVSVRVAGNVVEHETRQTTPESLDIQRYLAAMRDASVEWALLESTSHGLAAHRLDEVDFGIGAVTNITHEHLEFHGSIDAYRRAKASLFERVADAGGWAVVNVDDEGARSVVRYASGAKLLSYSRSGSKAEIGATAITCHSRGSDFRVDTPYGSADFFVPYVGEFNVENALCAIGVSLAAGIGLDVIVDALAVAPPVPGRMVAVEAGQPFRVIVDYAHTPESLEKILRLLRRLNQGGRMICVSGSAGERDRAKRRMQGRVSAELAELSVFTTEDPRMEDAAAIIDEIAEGAIALGRREPEDFVRIVDRQEAIDFAVANAAPGDVMLLAGKGHERSIIWGLEKRPWDEVAAARQALARLGYGDG
jgi:UDP-N-acetylmuramoyl-L-alanyl-D-glutamate--2,6-diaminopimelate ligase